MGFGPQAWCHCQWSWERQPRHTLSNIEIVNVKIPQKIDAVRVTMILKVINDSRTIFVNPVWCWQVSYFSNIQLSPSLVIGSTFQAHQHHGLHSSTSICWILHKAYPSPVVNPTARCCRNLVRVQFTFLISPVIHIQFGNQSHGLLENLPFSSMIFPAFSCSMARPRGFPIAIWLIDICLDLHPAKCVTCNNHFIIQCCFYA